MRYDLVDLQRWKEETPFYKFVTAMIVDLIAWIPILVVQHVAQGVIWALNRIRAGQRWLYRWSGFVPRVMVAVLLALAESESPPPAP